MIDSKISEKPKTLARIQSKSQEIGFSMPSDELVGSLLRTLVASKPNGNFLELGTGIGQSLSWMVDGMCKNSLVTSIDNDPELIKITKSFFKGHSDVSIICADGSKWIKNYKGGRFDLIFADAWPGKYSELDETLSLVKPGGFYVIDDMVRQPNWPEGHREIASSLIIKLEARKDFVLTKMNWSTGIIVMTKKAHF
ncbi:methyltransferase domain-containing protein [Muricauda sp. JGD-17]|uniref:Methyltransferase domain-containing protein n=1 Tax=Flagellimonas ochracea TaxID=2696472 RepID=A0A964TC91_9FLAO|nr:class I SAM-dependent methyltransferase [Allomuricauda ochracea]NAY92180.1 methyltransferase domain-containing protein [Allomuricauda ochracea]